MAAKAAPAAAKAAPAAPVSSAAIRAAIPPSTCPLALPPGPATAGEHCYSDLDAVTFHVRGRHYLTDRVKEPSGPAVFDLMHVEVFLSNDKIGNMAQRQESWLRRARAAGDSRYYLVVAYVTTAAPYIHLVLYFAVVQERVDALPHFKALWQRFTTPGAEADDFRNERWKVVPRIAEGSWVVQRAVGTKPALLATKLTHTWIFCDDTSEVAAGAGAAGAAAAASGGSSSGGGGGGGVHHPVESTSTSCGVAARVRGESFVTHRGPGPYLEADCDVASSSIALMLVSLMQSYAKALVIDLGFTIEPREEDECPEVVVGAVRLSRIDVSRPPVIAARAGDWVLGAIGVTHTGDGDE